MANTRHGKTKRIVIITIAIFVLVFFWMYYRGRENRLALRSSGESFYPAAQQDMTISFIEAGSIKAKKAVSIRSEMEGYSTIVNIIPEGTILTEDDVKKGTVILELDASQAKQDLNRQLIDYNTAMANLTEARENLDIQKNQNASDIQQGKLAVKFAMLDLQKYLGQNVAMALIPNDPNQMPKDEAFVALIDDPNKLGGESQQTLRQLQADINLATDELLRAQNTLYWTNQLVEKEYVAKTEQEADQLNAKRSEIKADQAKTAKDLFIRYEFPKQAQKLFSDFIESERQLERILAKARSQQAQAEAKLSSADATFALEKERLERLQRQIAASVIKAPCPGMVVYASQGYSSHGSSRSRTSIEVGREVREQEEIMQIPSALDVLVDAKVHETNIDKIVIGQKARITVDAMPDTVFQGEVTKIAPLPDPGSFLSNPDLKLYATEISLQGGETLRPGMSAKVEIIVGELKDVIAVPLQCVSNREGKKICYVHTLKGNTERPVVVGAYNDKFIEITEGLKPGEKVSLNPPRAYELQQRQGASKKEDPDSTDDSLSASPQQPSQDKSAQPARPRSGGQPPSGSSPNADQPSRNRPDRPGTGARPDRQTPSGSGSNSGQPESGTRPNSPSAPGN